MNSAKHTVGCGLPHLKHNYTISREPKNEHYYHLIDFVSKNTRGILLIIQPQNKLTKKGKTVLSKLNPFLITQKEVTEWPGTKLLSGHSALSYEYEISTSCLAIIKRVSHSLCDWKQPGLPEDIAFLRESNCAMLTTISHERDAHLSLSDAEYNELIDYDQYYKSILKLDPYDWNDGN